MLSVKIGGDEFQIEYYIETLDMGKQFIQWHYITSKDILLYEKYHDTELKPLRIPLVQILEDGEVLIEIAANTFWTCRYKKEKDTVYLVTSSLYEEGSKYTTPW